MGTRLPGGDYEKGHRCTACELEFGGPWPNNSSPKYFYAHFEGLTVCYDPGEWGLPAAPNGQTFILTQDPAHPCYWEYVSDTWFCCYFASTLPGPESLLLLQYFLRDGWWLYFSAVVHMGSDCLLSFVNALECNGMDIVCSGGACELTFSNIMPATASLLNIVPAQTLFLEQFPTDSPPTRVDKYCQQNIPMNVKILFEPP